MAATQSPAVIVRRMKKAGVDMVAATGAALMLEGFEMARLILPRIPTKVGILKRSLYVAPPIGLKNPSVEIGVGTKYAIFVHEDMKAHHPRGGRAKYIESVVNERRSGYVRRIAASTLKFFEKGFGVAALPKSAPSKPSEESKKA